jgi:hypothetical protein
MSFLARVRRQLRPPDTGAGDTVVLDHLRKQGADLSRARHVRHFAMFPVEEAARAAAATVEQAGYTVAVESPGPGRWELRAEITAVVDETTVGPARAWLTAIALDYGGDYDGWEAAARP